MFSWLLLSISLLSFSAWSAPETHSIDKGKKVTIAVPEGWESVKDLYGIPITVLGPWANESRPVLMYVFTHLKKSYFSQEDFEGLFKDFEKEKSDWVKTHNGTLIKYEPKTKVELRKDLQGHYIGAEFKINDIHFVERSYYLYCKEQVYNLKYSMRDEHRVHLPVLHQMIKEFKCE